MKSKFGFLRWGMSRTQTMDVSNQKMVSLWRLEQDAKSGRAASQLANELFFRIMQFAS